jgi:acyl carrier protein
MFPDGCIEYLGRTDNQVKIRGYRFELNEIESILIGNEHINEAIVLVLEDEDMNKKLTAFITGDGQISLLAVRDYLADKIPYYMIPEDFIQVERFQLTVNGKIDKGYLIGLKSKSIVRNVEYVAPGNDIEENLVEIWEGILNKERIGVNDNFFALGGNSLLVMKLINRIGNDFGMKIDFKSFFNKPTISSLALEILFMNEQKSLKNNNLTEVDI